MCVHKKGCIPVRDAIHEPEYLRKQRREKQNGAKDHDAKQNIAQVVAQVNAFRYNAACNCRKFKGQQLYPLRRFRFQVP
jgi:hypothetical protein